MNPTREEVGLFCRDDHRSQMLAVISLARRAKVEVFEARCALRRAVEALGCEPLPFVVEK